MAQSVNAGDSILTPTSPLDSQSSLPPPTSIEAIVHRQSNALPSDPSVDLRLAHVSKWTAVTKDNNLLVNLLSAWTEREYSYFHYLDRDAFLNDMATGRSVFCSELLVNAVLASACFHHSAITDRHRPFAETSIMTSFYQEAQRLWRLGSDKASIARVQAAMCLFLVLGKHGRDKIGHTYLLEACRMGRDLGFFDESPTLTNHMPLEANDVEWVHVRAVTAWALFNFQIQMSSVYSLPVIIHNPPNLSIPYQDWQEKESLFRSQCAKHMIVAHSMAGRPAATISTQPSLPKRDFIESCLDQLTGWWNGREMSIDPERNPSKENLLCGMMYYVDIINLYRCILQSEPSTDWTQAHIEHARQTTSSSLKALRRLLSVHEQKHGWYDAITLVLHPITVASFGSLEHILDAKNDAHPGTEQDSEPYVGLLICLRALERLSSYSYYAQPLFRLLVQKCQSLGLQISAGMQRTLDQYTSEEWTKEASSLVSSQYIADLRIAGCNPTEDARMDAIISTWERLSLDEAGKGKARAS